MKTLRLLVTKQCSRNCEGCCNKDWDLDKLPICSLSQMEKFDEIIITGGEPMLYPDLRLLLAKIRQFNRNAIIILYTQYGTSEIAQLLNDHLLNGITFTIHDKKGIEDFYYTEKFIYKNLSYGYLQSVSLRLNIFKGIPSIKPVLNWKIQDNMVWIKNCPLPENEVFMRYQ